MRILYFAWVREAVGRGEELIELPFGVSTVDQLVDWLAEQSEGHSAAFADRTRLRVAVDQQFADWGAPIAGAREVAFFPPVTGG